MMKAGIELNQQQTLDARMIQSVSMLQMNSQELKSYIEDIALSNPVIDINDQEEMGTKEDDIQRKLEWLENSDYNNRVYHQQDYEPQAAWDQTGAEPQSENLEDYLKAQLLVSDMEEEIAEITEFLIRNLDAKGYFLISLEETGRFFNVPSDCVEKALKILQSLEPAGVGARDLQECLLLQLKRMVPEDCIAERIVSEHLDLVGKNQLPLVAKRMGIPLEEVKAAVKIICKLNPKPGNSFSDRGTLNYIIPDITLVKLQDYYEILINDYLYPRITINRHYKTLLTETNQQEVKSYIAEKVEQAEWICNCIERRNETLLSLCKLIVNEQITFFEYNQELKPMTMREAAQKLNVHESTVSRAVKDKYLQCTQGVYPLSYFFVKKFKSEENNQMTAEQIQQIMMDVIENEDKKKPLSDQKIVRKLEEQGCVISRRTVAKYRNILQIKDASGRKEH